jgi:hypothetical protein
MNMTRYVAAIAAGTLLGVLIGGAVFILTIEKADGKSEIAW